MTLNSLILRNTYFDLIRFILIIFPHQILTFDYLNCKDILKIDGKLIILQKPRKHGKKFRIFGKIST